MRVLAGLLRLGIALDRTYRRAVRQVDASVDDASITVDVAVKDDVDVEIELFTARRNSSLLAGALGRSVNFRLVTASQDQRQRSHPVYNDDR